MITVMLYCTIHNLWMCRWKNAESANLRSGYFVFSAQMNVHDWRSNRCASMIGVEKMKRMWVIPRPIQCITAP